MKLTQERLKELFDYREDGNLIWKKPEKRQHAKIGDIAGFTNSDGYIVTWINKKQHYNHRLIWCWHHGYFPEGLLDHKDRIKHHNWIDNLKEASKQCNARNTGNPKDNTSGVKGVIKTENGKKWYSQIWVKKMYNLGSFEDFDEAVCHRLAAEQCLNWSNCDSNSPAYLWVKNNIQNKNIFRGLKKIKRR